MPERENPPMIWFKIGKAEDALGEYRGFFTWEEVIDKIKPLVNNNGMNLITRSAAAPHAVECNEFRGSRSIYLYWGDEFGKMENAISDAEVALLNTAIFQGTATLPNEPSSVVPTVGEKMQNIVFFFKSSLLPERQKQINEWLDGLTEDQRQMIDEIVENQLDEEHFSNCGAEQ